MHRILRLLILTLLPLPALAEDGGIAATITGQMQAFTARDPVTAFSFASPMIRGIFGTPDNFAAMVQSGYPMVWTPQDYRLLDLHDRDGTLWQRVLVTDMGGQSWMLDYQMVETPDGWKINAVELLPGSDPGV